MMDGRYSTRSPAVKRLMREAQELSEPTDQYFAQPLDDNLFEWHFTIRGPADSDFQNGIYHGRIILPVDYPMKPPSIIWLTPNGRFETNKKICLSISGHHPESWQPSWSIRTALLAIIGFMPTHPGGAIGSLDYTPDERKGLAKKTKDWKCPTCGEVTGILLASSANSAGPSNEAKELAAQINFQGEKPKTKEKESVSKQTGQKEIQSSITNQVPISQQARVENSGEAFTTTDSHMTSSPIVDANQSPTLSPPSFPPQMTPPFMQWSPGLGPYPVPPVGFPPFQFPSMPPTMQFPYPPSFYSTMPQSTWPMPSGMGMPPPSSPSFPPCPPSTNNSSASASGRNDISANRTRPPSNTAYTRTPMTCPVSTHQSQPGNQGTTNTERRPSGSTDVPQVTREKTGDIFKELLSKVKRVGSDSPQCSPASNPSGTEALVKPEIPASSLSDAEALVKPEIPEKSGVPAKPDLSVGEGTHHKIHPESKRPLEEGDTDSEVSKSFRKIGEKSVTVSELGDTNTEDNSDSGVPPIDADPQSSIFEKGACSSTSELEKWKKKYQATTKTLRQRQSATASVPSEEAEEAVIETSDTPQPIASRRRIEAASGDVGTRTRPRHGGGAIRLENNRIAPVVADIQVDRGSPDWSFFLMMGLLTSSLVILINRLAQLDWSD